MQDEDKIRYTYNLDNQIDDAFCRECERLLKPVWENNGFAPPDPTHLEIVGYEKCH